MQEEYIKLIFGLKLKQVRTAKDLSLFKLSKLTGLSKSYLNEIEKGKKYFCKLFFISLWKYPSKFPTAMTLAVYGFHFRRVIRTV